MLCLSRHDKPRKLLSWWGVVDEVRKAVDMGYGLVCVLEFWEYKVTCYDKDTNSGGLFAAYVNMILKLKEVSYGYRSWVQSEEDKSRYIEDYRREEWIALDKASISNNAGQRNLAKLKLSSLWGKWVQNQNKTQASLVNSLKQLYELLTCRYTKVTHFIFPNDDVVWVSLKYSEDNIVAGTNINVAVPAYITTQARLKLYDYLSELVEPVLYCDTYSAILTKNVDEQPKMKKMLLYGSPHKRVERVRLWLLYSRMWTGWSYKLCVFCFMPLDSQMQREECKL